VVRRALTRLSTHRSDEVTEEDEWPSTIAARREQRLGS
jgi:hypothetical protein